MRTLITIVIAALSLNAFGQGIPQLPYNPDENGDGLIGVPDLQALLSQYGLEFNSAVLSEDAQSAIVYMGNTIYPLCYQACDNLPGFWNIATLGDLGLVWDEITSGNAWLKKEQNSTYLSILSGYNVSTTTDVDYNFGCYCAAHELPKVEYDYCSGGTPDSESFVGCINEKLAEGWYPLSGWPLARDKQGYVYGNDNITHYSSQTHASFWRWAE